MSGAFKCFLKRKEKYLVLCTDDYEIYCGVVKKDYIEEQAREIMQREIDKLNFVEDRKDSEKYKILSCCKDVLFYPVGHKENTEELRAALRKHATIAEGTTEPLWIFEIRE
ncbi:hypothetical protein [Fusobacterium varium]|uniref:hypothetical protein n=1 Tax=Fusobacterium varium TaxID=856 RepID=UPI0030487FF9